MAQVMVPQTPPIAETSPTTINIREYKCEYCGKNYSSANSLKTHIKWHTGDLKHQCGFCEKKFRNHSELRRHEMVHTGERPNKCVMCDKQFIQKHALKDHMRKRHPDAVVEETTLSISGGSPGNPSSENSRTALSPRLNSVHHLPRPSVVQGPPPAAVGRLSTATAGGNAAVYAANSKSYDSEEMEDSSLTCRFCQEEFEDEYLLMQHEEEEAKEFQALHESFEKKEFGELESFSLQEYLGHSELHAEAGLESDSYKNNNNVEKLEYINIDLETLQTHVVPHMKLETEAPLELECSAAPPMEISTLQLKTGVQEFFLKRSEPVILQQKSSSDTSSILSSLLSSSPASSPSSLSLQSSKPKSVFSPSGLATGGRYESSGGGLDSAAGELRPRSTSGGKNGGTAAVLLPNLPLPLDSIDPGKIPLNINLQSLNDVGLPSKPVKIQECVELVPGGGNTADFFHTLQRKYNYLDLKLGFPGNSVQQAKIETDSGAPSGSSRCSTVCAELTTPQLKQEVDALKEEYPDHRVMSLAELGFLQSSAGPARQQVRSTAYLHTTQHNHSTASIDVLADSVVQQHNSSGSNQQMLFKSEPQQAQPLDLQQQMHNQPLPFAQKSTPSMMFYAVKQEVELDTSPLLFPPPERHSSALAKKECIDVKEELGAEGEFSFIALDTQEIQQLAINTQVKQEKVEGRDIGAFCQGLLNEMDNTTWTHLNIDEFQLTKHTEQQTISLQPVQVQEQQHQQFLAQQQQQHMGPTVYQQQYQQEYSLEQQLQEPQQQLEQQIHQQLQLQQSDWTTDSTSIPKGWMIKYIDYVTGTKVKKKSNYLSPEGYVFQSRKEAIDYLIRTSADEADISLMKKGLKLKAGGLEWKQGGEDVPKDWKIREVLSSDKKLRTFYLSPGGLSFPCRQAAYDHMIKVGTYSPQDMMLMRMGIREKVHKSGGGKDKLFTSGDPTLPPGWKVRLNSQGRENFRSPSGQFFHTRQSVVDYMVMENYPKHQVELMSSKIVKKSRSKSSVSKPTDWRENDPTVPVNWKIRQVTTTEGLTIITFLTPEGVTIRGRKAALTHMLKTGLYSAGDVEIMRQYSNVLCKISDTWIAGDPSLPAGWRIRKYNSKPTSKRVHCDFLSPENHVIRSRKGVLEHMRKTGGYTADDFLRVEQAQNKPERRKTEDMEPRFLSAVLAKSAETKAEEQRPVVEGVWVEADFLPTGWFQRDGTFMNSENEIFFSVNEVLEHLEKYSGLSSLEVSRLRRLLLSKHVADAVPTVRTENLAAGAAPGGEAGGVYSHEAQIGRGWKLCPNLPKGWRIKTHFWGNREKHLFRSPEGKIFNSRKLAVEYVESTGSMSPEDLERLKAGPRKRKKKENVWVNGKRRKVGKTTSITSESSESESRIPGSVVAEDITVVAADDIRTPELKPEKREKKIRPLPPAGSKMSTRNSGRIQEGKYENILAGNEGSRRERKESGAVRGKREPSSMEKIPSATQDLESRAASEILELINNVELENRMAAEVPVVIEPVQDIMEVEDDMVTTPALQCKSINHNATDVFLMDELDKSMEEN